MKCPLCNEECGIISRQDPSEPKGCSPQWKALMIHIAYSHKLITPRGDLCCWVCWCGEKTSDEWIHRLKDHLESVDLTEHLMLGVLSRT